MIVANLTPEHCASLAPRMRDADRIDCAAFDYDAGAALECCRTIGPAWAIIDPVSERVMGAAGYAPSQGSIWSLWAEGLTRDHQRWIMANTAPAVRGIVLRAKQLLVNFVWEGNHSTLRWLRASKCFHIDEAKRHPYKGHNYILFAVKPLEELPYV